MKIISTISILLLILGCTNISTNNSNGINYEHKIKKNYTFVKEIKLPPRKSINSIKIFEDKLYILDAREGSIFSSKIENIIQKKDTFINLFRKDFHLNISSRTFLQDFCQNKDFFYITNTYDELFIIDKKTKNYSIEKIDNPDKVTLDSKNNLLLITSRITPDCIYVYHYKTKLLKTLSFQDGHNSSKLLTNKFFLSYDKNSNKNLIFSRKNNSFYKFINNDYMEYKKYLELSESKIIHDKIGIVGKPLISSDSKNIKTIILPVITEKGTFIYTYGKNTKADKTKSFLKNIEKLSSNQLDTSTFCYYKNYIFCYSFLENKILVFKNRNM